MTLVTVHLHLGASCEIGAIYIKNSLTHLLEHACVVCVFVCMCSSVFSCWCWVLAWSSIFCLISETVLQWTRTLPTQFALLAISPSNPPASLLQYWDYRHMPTQWHVYIGARGWSRFHSKYFFQWTTSQCTFTLWEFLKALCLVYLISASASCSVTPLCFMATKSCNLSHCLTHFHLYQHKGSPGYGEAKEKRTW